jgi:exonuclease SbcC
LRDADQRADTAAASLTAQLGQHDIGVEADTGPTELLAHPPSRIAAAVATAESTLQHAERRQRDSEHVRAEMQALRESASVAHELSNLMRANQFPRWLIASALDALLLDASKILSELSGGSSNIMPCDHQIARRLRHG